MSNFKLMCTLCALTLDNKLLVEDYTNQDNTPWRVCCVCAHLQRPNSQNNTVGTVIKRVGLYERIKFFYRYALKFKNISCSMLFYKPVCIKCQSTNLFNWDGKCPRCGAVLISTNAYDFT